MASQQKKFDHSIEYSAIYWNTHARWIREQLGLGQREHDETTMVVDIVDMARDPRPALTWAFDGVGLDLAPIESLIERFPGDPGRLDEWRDSLDDDRQRRIEEYCFTEMRHLGYGPSSPPANERSVGSGVRSPLPGSTVRRCSRIRHRSGASASDIASRWRWGSDADRRAPSQRATDATGPYSRSMMVTLACPPPSHIVCRP